MLGINERRMKGEGREMKEEGRMKDEGRGKIRPSSLVPHPSSLVLLIPRPSSLIPHLSSLIQRESGVTVVAAILAVLLLGALGSGMAYFIASGQQTRIQQVTSDQSFYSNQAGMEFALGKVLQEGSSATSFTKKFVSETITITRSGGLLTVATAKNNAQDQHSITDPNPVDPANCLLVDSSAASVTANVLSGISLSRDPSCTLTLTINTMTGTSWTPNLSELLTTINIGGGGNEFSGSAGSGGAFVFGSPFAISTGASFGMDMTWNVANNMTNHNFVLIFNFDYNGSSFSKTVNVNFLANNQANCFTWNTASAVMDFNSNTWQRLTGTTISNSCAQNIRLSSVAVSWTPLTPTANLTALQVDAVTIFSGSSASGATSNSDNIIPASGTQTVNYFQFDVDMLGRDYSIIWTFADGTTTTTPLSIFNANENNCLTIDTSGVSVSTTDILGLTIQNACAADIGITDITLSWEAEASRRFTRAEVFDIRVPVNIYTGSFASGAIMTLQTAGATFGNLYLTDGSGVKNVQLIRFNNNVTPGLAFTLTFTMAGGTTKSVTFTPESHANCLSVDTSAAAIATTDLTGITMTNNCGGTITWTQTNVAWTPLSPTRNLTQIRVSNQNIFSGTAASGVTVNNTDRTFTAGQTRPINRFRFDATMAGTLRTYTIQFIMSDSSIKTVVVGPL